MEAKDLMIGDWVLEGGLYPHKVGGIDEQIDGMLPECYSPIPLTPEILKKNGFENDFYEDESVADYVKVRLEGYSLRCKANGWDDALVTWCNGHLEVITDFNGEVRKDIDHVHQLQHALRICGIDKEIVVC